MDQNRSTLYTHRYLHAAKQGDIETIQTVLPILSQSPWLLNVTTPKGESALILAVRQGHLDIIKLLIDNKVDVNIQTDFGLGYTALMYAVEAKSALIVEALLLAKANVELKDCKGNSAISLDVNQMIKRTLEGGGKNQGESQSSVLWAFYHDTGALSARFLPVDTTKPDDQKPPLSKSSRYLN